MHCLSLSSPFVPAGESPTILVPVVDALRLRQQEVCEELPTSVALGLFAAAHRLPRNMLGRLAAGARLGGISLRELTDDGLRQAVRHAIQRRLLVAVRRGAREGTGQDASARQRKLVRRIEQQTRGRLDLAGRRYRLVADADLGGLANRDNYQVVAREEAVRALANLARRPDNSPELAALFEEAQAMLAADWRPPMYPEGLVMLRRIPIAASVPSSAVPALTPSQLREQHAPVEQVDPLIEGTEVELDMSVAELPAESDEATAEDSAAPDAVAASDSSDEAASPGAEATEQEEGQDTAEHGNDVT